MDFAFTRKSGTKLPVAEEANRLAEEIAGVVDGPWTDCAARVPQQAAFPAAFRIRRYQPARLQIDGRPDSGHLGRWRGGRVVEGAPLLRE